MDEREINLTWKLVFSIIICVIGNSFLYGYNIGVINNPSGVIRVFYVETLAVRNGMLPSNWMELRQKFFASTPEEQAAMNEAWRNMTNIDNSSIDDTFKVLKTKSEDDNNIEILWSVTVAIFVLFGMIGAFASGKFADKFGRKRGMIIITVLMFLAAIFGGIPKLLNSFEVIIIHRAIVGLHCGLNVSLASLYLAEISPKKIRGAIGTCHQLFITIGILWSNIMGVSKLAGTYDRWEWLFIFNAFPALICLVFMPLCPESPRYLLIKRGLEEEAIEGLRDLRGYQDVKDEIDEMKIEARRLQHIQEFSLKQMLTTPELRIPIAIACCLKIAQQFSGINAVMAYSKFMYNNAGMDLNLLEWVVCLTSTITVLTTIPAEPLMEKLGRRPLLINPMMIMALSFIILIFFHNIQYVKSYEDSHLAYIIGGIIAINSYALIFVFGLGPISFVVIGEIFKDEALTERSMYLTFDLTSNFILSNVFRFMQVTSEQHPPWNNNTWNFKASLKNVS